MRYFYVLKITDQVLEEYINAIRYLANPLEKNYAHITIRGPYNSPIDVTEFNKIIKDAEVKISSVDTFFSSKQNTVLLRCYSDLLQKIWHKPDYGFNPHIALYDGPSRSFAEGLVKLLNSHLINFKFKVDKLYELKSIKGQFDYRLFLETKENYINRVIGIDIKKGIVEKMDEGERLFIINDLIYYLTLYKSQRKLNVTLYDEYKEKKYDLYVLRDG